MKLSSVAKSFDKEAVYDAYTNSFLFRCQTAAFDDSSSTGATARRRTLSVAPGTSIPARRAVKIFDEYLIVSDKVSDGFLGEVIRESYGMKKSTGLLSTLTPSQACLVATGTPFHAHKLYFKDILNTQNNAAYDVFWNIFCPPGETVSKGSFFRDADSVLYRVRNAYVDIEGFRVAETDQLDNNALQTAVFTTNGAVNLVTDVRPTISTTTTVIQVDFTKFYVFRTQPESDLKPGDITVFVATSALTPAVGATFTMLGRTWKVLSVVPEIDTWALHVRLA